jgi:4-amino-4-deoxy-L-arabinose transferase-like glycosyltransferase
MARLPRSFSARLAAIAAVALALRVLHLVLVAEDVEGVGDFFFYHGSANLLADGRGYIDPFLSTASDPYPTALHPPLWPLALAVVSKLGFTSILAHRMLGCLLGAVVVALIGLLGRRVLGDRAGLIAAGIAAVYPTLIAADGSLMSETLYGLFVAVVLLLAYRMHERPTPALALAMGVAIGLSALTRGEGVFFLPLLAVPLAWRGGGAGRVPRLACAVAGVALVVLPWTVRNDIRLDRPILISTNDSTVVAGANCDGVYSGPDIGFWHLDCISEREPGLNEAEQAAIWRRQGTDYARDHLARMLAVVVPVRVLRTWDFFQPRHQATTAEGRPLRVQQAGTAVYYLLLVLAVLGAIALRRARRPIWMLVVPAIAVSLSSALGFGLPRFRQAAEIAIVVLAAVAIERLLVHRSRTVPGSRVLRTEPVSSRGRA